MIIPSDYIHPEDEEALNNMRSIPGFQTLVKTFLKIGYEKLIYGTNMASMIKLSPVQLPEIYHRLPPICKKLGIEEPDFFLEMNPVPNAYTFGDTRIFVVVTSGLLEYLDDEEINSVLAHECGHIACRHVLYHTMADMMVNGLEGILGTIATPFKLPLLYWQRKSELSCDRAAALVTSVEAVLQTQVRLAGGPKSITGKINIEEWAKQADRYEEIRSGGLWNKTLQTIAIAAQSHPFAAVRVREILKWGKSEQYRTIKSGGSASSDRCPSCGTMIDKNWKFCRNCGHSL